MALNSLSVTPINSTNRTFPLGVFISTNLSSGIVINPVILDVPLLSIPVV